MADASIRFRGIYALRQEVAIGLQWAVRATDSRLIWGSPGAAAEKDFYLYDTGECGAVLLQSAVSGKYVARDADGLALLGSTQADGLRLEIRRGGQVTSGTSVGVSVMIFATPASAERSSVVATGAFAAPMMGQAVGISENIDLAGPLGAGTGFGLFTEFGIDSVCKSRKGRSLPWADLSGLDLSGVDFHGCDLSHAVLTGTDLRGANLKGVDLSYCDLTVAKLDTCPDLGQAGTTPAKLRHATVPFSLLGRDWSHLDLSQAKIVGVPQDLSTKEVPLRANGANLSQVEGLTGKLSYACFDDATLNDVNLASFDLEGASLRRAYLKGARFSRANLKCADLTGAWLIAREDGQNREPADFSDAFMANAVFDNVQGDGVVFEGAQMYYYGGFDGESASARGAFFNLAKFGKANLYKFDFTDAKLRGADFVEANLVNATLHNVDLTSREGPPLTATSMSKADLRGTDCTGANMRGTILTDAQSSDRSGTYHAAFDDGRGGTIQIVDDLAVTHLGQTDQETVCPNGSRGPCQP